MTFILSFLLTWTFVAGADAVTFIEQRHISPICSTAETEISAQRVSLPNTHVVIAKNRNNMPIYRSNSPYKSQHILDIKNLGIKSVIVYKTFHNQKDKDLLYRLYEDSGYDTSNLEHVPMPWKREGKKPFDFKGTCEMTVVAIEALMNSTVPILFHCTVGEDRTGLLAGLLQVVNGMSVDKAFRDEMCARGYEAGNPRKSQSPSVVKAVREVLTPLYLKMATVIQNRGVITKDDCAQLPESYVNDLRVDELMCESAREETLCPIDKVAAEEESPFGLPLAPLVLPFEF